MSDRTLLWIDLCLESSTQDTTRYFNEFFTIRKNTRNGIDDTGYSDRPVALVFDYDFPDRAGLRLLEETKRQRPSIPLLMLTVQHSEELAIWAFRARVWDYFVKPVGRSDVERCYESLSRINNDTMSRSSVRISPPVPAEIRRKRAGTDGERLLAPAIAFVKAHYADKLSQKEIAALCGMSTFRFSRSFHATYGQTFQNYVMRYRMARAEELLMNPAIGVTEVAFAVGFRDASYFGRAFRKFHRMSPTQWRHHQHRDERPALMLENRL